MSSKGHVFTSTYVCSEKYEYIQTNEFKSIQQPTSMQAEERVCTQAKEATQEFTNMHTHTHTLSLPLSFFLGMTQALEPQGVPPPGSHRFPIPRGPMTAATVPHKDL